LITAKYEEEYGNWLKEHKDPHEISKRSVVESLERKANWEKNYESIQQHNARYAAGKETYVQGLNKFSDLVNIYHM